MVHANRYREKLAVLFLDIDRFKVINDSLGHSIGDALLRRIAERVGGCIRQEDTIARLGGDEFTVLLPGIAKEEDAATIANKILEAVRLPFFIEHRELFITTSIGVTLFPADGADPETLVRNADTAMYRAKEQGRDNYQLYAPAMQNAELSIFTLWDLKNLGVSLSMDDFGTGYSSLNYLKRFPIDRIKIDQSFVRDVTRDPDDAAIAAAIIAMAHSLKLTAVAEGVETEAQLEFLRAQRCDEMQGYLFSPPVPAEKFEELLESSKAFPPHRKRVTR